MTPQIYDKFSVIGSVVEVRIQIPKYSFLKRNNRGGVELFSPIPTFFNYGCIDVWRAEDGDAADAVVLGSRMRVGERVRMRVRAVIQFEDAGCDDSKCICAAQDLSGFDRVLLSAFFVVYASIKRAIYLLRGVRGATRYRGWIIPAKQGSSRS